MRYKNNIIYSSLLIFILGFCLFIPVSQFSRVQAQAEAPTTAPTTTVDYGIQVTTTSCFDFNWVVMYSIASLLIIIFLSLQLNITGFNFFQLFLFFAIGGWITTILNECGISYLGLIIAIVLTFLFW